MWHHRKRARSAKGQRWACAIFVTIAGVFELQDSLPQQQFQANIAGGGEAQATVRDLWVRTKGVLGCLSAEHYAEDYGMANLPLTEIHDSFLLRALPCILLMYDSS